MSVLGHWIGRVFELTGEKKRLQAELKNMTYERNRWVDDFEQLQAEGRLALQKYGNHLKGCPCYIPEGDWGDNSHHTKTDDELNTTEKDGVMQTTLKCTCGFEQALKGDTND